MASGAGVVGVVKVRPLDRSSVDLHRERAKLLRTQDERCKSSDEKREDEKGRVLSSRDTVACLERQEECSKGDAAKTGSHVRLGVYFGVSSLGAVSV